MADKLADLGDLWVTAPNRQYSGAGRSFHFLKTGSIEERESLVPNKGIRSFAIAGSPATTVMRAIQEILPNKPDLVVSGINYGENLGNIVTCSGTIGAAFEAASLGFKALAVSLEINPDFGYINYTKDVDFSVAAYFGNFFAESILTKGLPTGVDILKVDVPDNAIPETPWRLTRVSKLNPMPLKFEQKDGSNELDLIHLPRLDSKLAEPDSDIAALYGDHVVSVSPMVLKFSPRRNLSFLGHEYKGH